MKLKILKWLIVAIILISLSWFVYSSDWNAIRANIQHVGFNFFWIILITFLAQVFGTLSWQCTLPKDVKVAYKDLFLIRYIGEHLGLVNPANFVGGDAFKAYHLEKHGVQYSDSISSLLVSRMIMIYVQVLVFLGAALYYWVVKMESSEALIMSIVLSILFLVALFVAALFSDKVFSLPWIQNWGLKEKALSVRDNLRDYFKYEKKRFAMAHFWGVVNFLIGALEIWLICSFIGVEISYLEALLIDQGVLFLKSFAAFVPGQVGVEEYINKLMLGIIGVTSTTVWISVSLFRRTRQLFWLLLGIPVYYFIMRPGLDDDRDLVLSAGE